MFLFSLKHSWDMFIFICFSFLSLDGQSSMAKIENVWFCLSIVYTLATFCFSFRNISCFWHIFPGKSIWNFCRSCFSFEGLFLDLYFWEIKMTGHQMNIDTDEFLVDSLSPLCQCCHHLLAVPKCFEVFSLFWPFCFRNENWKFRKVKWFVSGHRTG